MNAKQELVFARRWRVVEVNQLKSLIHRREKPELINAQMVDVIESCLNEGVLTERLRVEEEAS